MNKTFLAFLFFIVMIGSAKSQYHKVHYIAPAPWQYWSTANEIVIGTISETPVTVQLKKVMKL
ncbi:hypothetical protein QNH98_17260 [Myroides sp. mNGS23_01]|nr:hypothetical protein [Myroides sp. mNGS23_01]WHT38714.1 hypothetical protein QNH98_17260 [Myroides sp. mNGS23_01]